MNSMIGEDLEFLPSPEAYQYQKKIFKKKLAFLIKILYIIYIDTGYIWFRLDLKPTGKVQQAGSTPAYSKLNRVSDREI